MYGRIATPDLIVDEILIGKKFEAYLQALQYCGLFAPIEVIEKREIVRGDRLAGQAQPDYERVHAGKNMILQ